MQRKLNPDRDILITADTEWEDVEHAADAQPVPIPRDMRGFRSVKVDDPRAVEGDWHLEVYLMDDEQVSEENNERRKRGLPWWGIDRDAMREAARRAVAQTT